MQLELLLGVLVIVWCVPGMAAGIMLAEDENAKGYESVLLATAGLGLGWIMLLVAFGIKPKPDKSHLPNK